jgi:hypothetical protein
MAASCGDAILRGGGGGPREATPSGEGPATSKGSLHREHVTRFPANSGRYLYVAPHAGHEISVLISRVSQYANVALSPIHQVSQETCTRDAPAQRNHFGNAVGWEQPLATNRVFRGFVFHVQ